MRNPTPEERELGLDPSKYNLNWRPADYIGWSHAAGLTPQKPSDEYKALEALRSEMTDNEAIRKEQEKLLGPEQTLTPEQIAKNKKQMLYNSLGLDETITNVDNNIKFFAQPEKVKLLKELGVETKYGIPVFEDDDIKRIEDSQENVDRRTELLRQLME